MKIIKQNKLWYYLRNYAIVFLGKRGGYQQRMAMLKAEMSEEQLAALEARVTYYCKLLGSCCVIWRKAYQRLEIA